MDVCACVYSMCVSSGELQSCRLTKTQLIRKRSAPTHQIHTKTFHRDDPVSGEVCLLSHHAHANLLQDVEAVGLGKDQRNGCAPNISSLNLPH